MSTVHPAGLLLALLPSLGPCQMRPEAGLSVRGFLAERPEKLELQFAPANIRRAKRQAAPQQGLCGSLCVALAQSRMARRAQEPGRWLGSPRAATPRQGEAVRQAEDKIGKLKWKSGHNQLIYAQELRPHKPIHLNSRFGQAWDDPRRARTRGDPTQLPVGREEGEAQGDRLRRSSVRPFGNQRWPIN